ncbi:MAG: hypothetical protein WA840_06940 [Caulobacteraceae bacterium]
MGQDAEHRLRRDEADIEQRTDKERGAKVSRRVVMVVMACVPMTAARMMVVPVMIMAVSVAMPVR